MSRRPRRNHTPAFKAKVALAAIKGDRLLADLAQQFDVHPNQITQWKAQLLEGASGVFGSDARAGAHAPGIDLKTPPHPGAPTTRSSSPRQAAAIRCRFLRGSSVPTAST